MPLASFASPKQEPASDTAHHRATQENQASAAHIEAPARACSYRVTYGILCVTARQKLGTACRSSTCRKASNAEFSWKERILSDE